MIRRIITLQVTCDVCQKKSAPYDVEEQAEEKPLPPPFLAEKRWNQSWQSLIERHYCSPLCADTEGHGLQRNKGGRPPPKPPYQTECCHGTHGCPGLGEKHMCPMACP